MSAPAVTAPAVVAPPARWLWAYRLLGLRVPEQHRAWVAHDVASDTGVRRVMRWRLVPFALFVGWTFWRLLDAGSVPWGVLAGLIGPAVSTHFAVRGHRRKVLQWQHVDASGHRTAARGVASWTNRRALLVGALFVLVSLSAVEGLREA